MPRSSNIYKLNEECLRYLEFYSSGYSEFIAICPQSSNYFIKTFLNLGYTNEAIMYSLVSWGCLASDSYDKAKFYMLKASKMMYDNYSQKSDKLREDIYVLLCFYLIVIGWEICSGDVKKWYNILKQSKSLIDSCGGLATLSEKFHQSTDVEWLISDFQFHDILSSATLEMGTLYPIEDYRKSLPQSLDYGIDPLQGCLRPLYLILGGIKNCSASLTKNWLTLEGLMNKDNSEEERKRINGMRID